MMLRQRVKVNLTLPLAQFESNLAM